jgi:hypothetical protein
MGKACRKALVILSLTDPGADSHTPSKVFVAAPAEVILLALVPHGLEGRWMEGG